MKISAYVVLAILCMACCFGDIPLPGATGGPPPPALPAGPTGASCDVPGNTHTCTHRSAAEVMAMGSADLAARCVEYQGRFDGTRGCTPVGAMGYCRYADGTVEVLYPDGPMSQSLETFSGFCVQLGGAFTLGAPPP